MNKKSVNSESADDKSKERSKVIGVENQLDALDDVIKGDGGSLHDQIEPTDAAHPMINDDGDLDGSYDLEEHKRMHESNTPHNHSSEGDTMFIHDHVLDNRPEQKTEHKSKRVWNLQRQL